MATTESDRLDVTKLDGRNYGVRKFKMRLLLMQRSFWEVVGGMTQDATKGKMALIPIGLSVQDSHLVRIQRCGTGKEAWDSLASLYENKGVANKMPFKEGLMTSRMRAEDSAQENMDKLQQNADKLAALGIALDANQYKLALLRVLPRSMNVLLLHLRICLILFLLMIFMPASSEKNSPRIVAVLMRQPMVRLLIRGICGHVLLRSTTVT